MRGSGSDCVFALVAGCELIELEPPSLMPEPPEPHAASSNVLSKAIKWREKASGRIKVLSIWSQSGGSSRSPDYLISIMITRGAEVFSDLIKVTKTESNKDYTLVCMSF